MIFKIRSKTGVLSRIPLLPKAEAILNKYDWNIPMLKNPTTNQYLKLITNDAKINKTLTFHMARHTFATTVTLANGVSLNVVSKMLGHSSISTTEHYAKVLDSQIINEMNKLI